MRLRHVLAVVLVCALARTGTSVGQGEHGFCELCMYAVHQVQYGELPSCGGSSRAFSYDACSQVTQSMLSFAQDTMHLISYGCYEYDAYKGWQTVKPCPAHVICGRLPNIYDTQQHTLCPADFHYRFPHALGNRAPTVFNPLLKYAVNQYQAQGMPTSSVLQTPGVPAGLPRFRRQSATISVAQPHSAPAGLPRFRRQSATISVAQPVLAATAATSRGASSPQALAPGQAPSQLRASPSQAQAPQRVQTAGTPSGHPELLRW
jgi:hypothetical protein